MSSSDDGLLWADNGFSILSLNLACCSCYVAYEMFQGFDTSQANTTGIYSNTTSGPVVGVHKSIRTTVHDKRKLSPTATLREESATAHAPVTSSKFGCPEEELPLNIGAYEVPTQRDIVLLVRKSLLRIFNSYHEKAFYFLNDIKEATKATAAVEKKCSGYGTDRGAYKQCVRQVSKQCESITKGLVTALESQRQDVSAFTNGAVCSVKGMKADPVELIKTLAMEEASLDFALPGFLRLLSACSTYCDKMEPQLRAKKPLRHMTDQDLVVKHFLTKKNYIQLIKGSK